MCRASGVRAIDCVTGVVDNVVVDVAVGPFLAPFERMNDTMMSKVIVLRSVPVGRAVATPDMPTRHAETKVHPPAPDPQAVLATGARRRLDWLQVDEMFTWHRWIPDVGGRFGSVEGMDPRRALRIPASKREIG